MSRRILDVLNNLEVLETNGGEDAYILVKNDESNRTALNRVGVTTETINKYGDDETFCILALAFSQGYANDFRDGKLRDNSFDTDNIENVNRVINAWKDEVKKALEDLESDKPKTADYVLRRMIYDNFGNEKSMATIIKDSYQFTK